MNVELKTFKIDFKADRDEQRDIINRDITILKSNLTATTNNINVVWTNLTHNLHRLDSKLNSTQEKQLELTSDVRNNGHGNKLRIDELTSQITNLTNDFEILDHMVNIDLLSQTNATNKVRPSCIT